MSSRKEGKTKAVALSVGADPDVRVFSPSKYKIMMMLRREGPMDLEGLSKKLSVSQMAAYKHVRELENRGLVTHESRIRGVGRPRLVFRPSQRAYGIYPTRYSALAIAALDSLDRKLGKEEVRGVLKQMQASTFPGHSSALGDGGLEEKVKKLVTLREAQGYMADVVKPSKGELEIIEHNCPIMAVAAKYPEVCEAEAEILAEALDASVKPVGLDPMGAVPCRFRITAR